VTATTDPNMVPVIAERDRLRAENQHLRDALEVFANPQHWGMTRDYGPERVPVWIGTYRTSPAGFARAALDGTPNDT
jgi:hypothetical protein